MMARLPVQAAAGLVRRLFHSSSNSEAVKLINASSDKSPSSISCLLWPLTSPLLGHAAIGWAGTPGHAYHRRNSSSTDEDHSSCDTTTTSSSTETAGASSSKSSSTKRGRRKRGNSISSSAPSHAHHRRHTKSTDEDHSSRDTTSTSSSSSVASSSSSSLTEAEPQQLQDLKRAFEDLQPSWQQSQRDRDAAEARQLPEHVARIAMRDPLGVLISSLGVPLGISLKVNRTELMEKHAEQSRSALDEFDLQGMMGGSSSTTDDFSDLQDEFDSSSQHWASDPSTSVPDTDMQRLRQELHLKTRRIKRNFKHQQASSAAAADAAEEAAAAAAAAAGEGSEGEPAGQGREPAAVQEQLVSIRAMIRANADRWGTTQQSPAEIAQQIADSNKAAGGGGGRGSDGDGSDDDGEGGEEEPLSLTPGEERYADPSAVAADLKEMDEIFEVLAKVPWLDDEDVDEKQLRGLAAVGLLGTLEEVGWTIRDKLLALWGGERDEAVLTAGLGPREASAMASILYHTQQLEEQYGQPPQASVEAALAAATLGAEEGEKH